jgi:hypothetical protein
MNYEELVKSSKLICFPNPRENILLPEGAGSKALLYGATVKP